MAKTEPLTIDQTLRMALEPESLDAFEKLASSLEAIIAIHNKTNWPEPPLPAGQSPVARMREAASEPPPFARGGVLGEATEAPEMFSLPMASYRRLLSDGLRVKNQRDKARRWARKLHEDLVSAQLRLEDARQRAQYDVTRWRDAEAEIKRLHARIGGDGNVLEANAQLRAENARLVEEVARLTEDRDSIESERDDLERRLEQEFTDRDDAGPF
jgi:hypothetical protein